MTVQMRQGKYRSRLFDFMEQYSLSDVWRLRHPRLRRYSFHRKHQASRIDYWLISEHLLNFVNCTDIDEGTLSDHSRVTLNLSYPQEKRGPGLWKFDNTFTTDSKYRGELSKLVDEKKLEYIDYKPIKKWEMMKYEIRKFTIRYSKEQRREAKKYELDLESSLSKLVADSDSGLNVEEEISSLRRELQEIELSKARAAIFRSKCNWSQLGERPTKYFLNLEKRNFTNKLITQLRGENGSIISGQKHILEAQEKYFERIYSENESDMECIDDNCPFTEQEGLTTLTETRGD